MNNEKNDRKFNIAPTGHKIPEGRSPDDPSMAFNIPDCGDRSFGQFSTPFVVDERDLPTEEDKKIRKPF